MLVTTIRMSTGPCVPRKVTPKLVSNSVALVQEGPSLSLMARKYTRIKDSAIPVFESM